MSWNKVYETDYEGNVVYGSKSALISYVRAGADIKIGFYSNATMPMLGKTFSCDEVKMIPFDNKNVTDISIACMYTENISTLWNATVHGTQFQGNAYHTYLLCNSDGFCDQSRWDVGAHTSRGSNYNQYSLQWFAKDADPSVLAQELCGVDHVNDGLE